MSQAATAPREAVGRENSSSLYLRAYRWMLLARTLEEKIASLYRAGKITGGVFIGKGQEAVSVALGSALRKGDIFSPLIRDQAGRLAFGESILDALRTYMGSRLGPMRGRDGNIHRGRPREGLLPMISHLGAMLSVVNGMLMARRFRQEHGVVGAAACGEGATSTGAFHEALNQAAIEKLPLVVMVTNNQYAYSTPNSRQFACADLLDRAIGYGVEGHSVDGTNLAACLETIHHAVAQARGGGGPQMILAHTLRLAGHGEHDDANYVDPAFRTQPVGQDCLMLAEQALLSTGRSDRATLDAWAAEAHQQVEDALAITLREATPDPSTESWCALSNHALIDGFPHCG